MKAFLSYSHTDGEFVGAVADKIGRPFVNIDRWSIQVGDDLIVGMERAIADSAIFVLFASRASLESVWVTFEHQTARYFQASQRLRGFLIVVLDDRLKPADFPDWMTRAKYL